MPRGVSTEVTAPRCNRKVRGSNPGPASCGKLRLANSAIHPSGVDKWVPAGLLAGIWYSEPYNCSELDSTIHLFNLFAVRDTGPVSMALHITGSRAQGEMSTHRYARSRVCDLPYHTIIKITTEIVLSLLLSQALSALFNKFRLYTVRNKPNSLQVDNCTSYATCSL